MAGNLILSAGPLPDWVRQKYLQEFQLRVISDSSRQELLENLSPDVVALISRGPLAIDAGILQQLPRLRCLARTGAGYDTVDVQAASRLRIPVLYAPEAPARAVAEHTLALMLAAAKDLPGWERRIREGRWQERNARLNRDLAGSAVGIVGLGRIGSRVAGLLKPFQASVLACDPYLNASRFPGISFLELGDLLARSDFVTLHVPLTGETRRLINRGNLGLFKTGAVLINTARGAVIESYDLLYGALQEGRLGAVAIDTLIEEPPATRHPIFDHPRAIFSAHVASRTPRAQRRVLETVGSELQRVLGGGLPDPEHVVNPEVLNPP